MKAWISILFICSASHFIFGQEYQSILKTYEDSSNYKIAIRTEEKVNDKYIALDNLTAKFQNDEVKVYYMNYGDAYVTSLTIPYFVLEKFLAFETSIIGAAEDVSSTEYAIKMEVGTSTLRIPVDVFLVERVSSFMLELEE